MTDRFVFVCICAYVLGSINFSILLFKCSGKGDPRNRFSQNAGATNVYRQAGLIWALMVLALDMGRAMLVAVLAQRLLLPAMVPWVGLALILGNRFPCFHGFRGGKGVANFLGFSILIAPIATLISALAWAITYRLVKIPFISSFVMVLGITIGTMYVYRFHVPAAMGTVFTAVLIYWSHQSNIVELIRNSRQSGPWKK